MTDEQFNTLMREIEKTQRLVFMSGMIAFIVVCLAALLVATGCGKDPPKDIEIVCRGDSTIGIPVPKDEVPADLDMQFMGDSLGFTPEHQRCLSPEESRQREQFCTDERWEDLTFLRDSICESWGISRR